MTFEYLHQRKPTWVHIQGLRYIPLVEDRAVLYLLHAVLFLDLRTKLDRNVHVQHYREESNIMFSQIASNSIIP